MKANRKTPREELFQILAAPLASGEIALCPPEEEEKYCHLIRTYFSLRSFPYPQASVLRLADSHTQRESAIEWAKRAALFLEEVAPIAKLKATVRVGVVWDDANYPILWLPFDLVMRYLEDLLWMPPHMYIFPPDVSWAICFRMEGDMGFGFKHS